MSGIAEDRRGTRCTGTSVQELWNWSSMYDRDAAKQSCVMTVNLCGGTMRLEN